jgi:hypothetical protein
LGATPLPLLYSKVDRSLRMRAIGLEDTGKIKALQVSLGDFLIAYILDQKGNKGGDGSIRRRNVQEKTLGACMA